MKKQKKIEVSFKDIKKSTRGITLIALVITIIILLILAGVTISQLTGSGLFEKAIQAKEKFENVQARENTILEDYEHTMNEYIEGYREQINDTKEQYEIIYVGELNRPTGNNGVVTSIFDIKNIYEQYQSLTINNFIYRIYALYDHWNYNCGLIGGKTLGQSYNSESGILTITNAYQIANFMSGIEGSVYLIPHISEISQ